MTEVMTYPGVLDMIKDTESKIQDHTGIKVSLMPVEIYLDSFKDVETIAKTICEATGVELEKVRAKTRKREVVAARHLVMYYAAIRGVDTLGNIGRYLGGRDHTTVLHGRDKILGFIESNDDLTIENITKINKLISE